MTTKTATKNNCEYGWVVAFTITLFFYLCLAALLTTSFDFNDETEKLITAMLLDSGLSLYKDIFVQHGPTSYMLSHIFYKIYPSHSLAPYRLIPIILALLTLAAVMFSPIHSTKRSRFIAGILFLFGLMAFQVNYTLVMTMYQVYAGYFYIISFVIFILPFAIGLKVKPWQAFVSGLCLSLVFFCGFSYAIAILFSLILCGFNFLSQPKAKNLIFYLITGGIFGTAINVLWLYLYGDFIGYFVDHVYFNMKFYGYYIAFNSSSFLAPFNLLNPAVMLFGPIKDFFPFPIFTFHIMVVLSLILFGLTTFQLKLFGTKTYRYVLNFIFLICAAIYTNGRFSHNFGGAAYIIFGIAFIAITASLIIEKQKLLSPLLPKSAVVMIILFLVSGVSLQFYKTAIYETSPIKYYKHKAILGPFDSEELRFLRSVVGENEGVMQIPFSLNFYIMADRLPASGIFYWMPWMNDYAKTPVAGYPLDLCQQMNDNPPKAIYFTDVDIWDSPSETFTSCFKDLLSRHYSPPQKVTNVWFRNDVAEK